jgi:outer membrane protein W
MITKMLKLGCLTIASAIATATASTLLHTTPAHAQAAYGSYVAVGPSFGGDNEWAADIAVRYKFLKAPISIRAQTFLGSNVALVPTVSYDIPINWQTDAYIGLGAAINFGGDTPVGNQTAFAIQPGVDYALPNSNMVVFGNAIFAVGGFEGGGTAVSVQGGVGLRF